MKKILLVGNGPLPDSDSSSKTAFQIRTAFFYQELEHAGFDVSLCLLADEDQKISEKQMLIRNDIKVKSKLKKALNLYSPDLVIACNITAASLVADLKPKIPFIADLNGWLPAEAQAEAYAAKSDALIEMQIKKEIKILKQADFICCVSKAQSYATYGELALLGVLNQSNFGKVMVTTIANRPLLEKNSKSMARCGFIKSPSSKMILWIGSFNNWVDIETLFEGLQIAMQQNPKLVFVSTGGNVKGLSNNYLQRFKEKIANSQYKDRFIFLGWLKNNQLLDVYRQADLGINCDLDCAETWFGARNRINEFLGHKIPVVSSKGSEIARTVGAYRLGVVFRSADAKSLAKAIETVLAEGFDQEFLANLNKYTNKKQADFNELINFCNNPTKLARLKSGVFARLNWYLKNKSFKDVLRKLGL
ncbi:glycosyltransferase family 4 protein [bacterium]|nr:glycosyltransferase family 4 protein [bacterium]